MSPILRAALWMSGAIVSFTAMAVAGRAVSFELDTFEIMLFRSLVGIVVVVSVASATGRLGQISTQRLRLHAARNLAHFAGQNLWFWSLTLIPLAQLFALEFSGPLWAMALAPLLLGERLTRINVLAGAIGFAGVIVVTRPWQAGFDIGILAAASAAFFFALTAIATRRLTRDQSLTQILFWLTVMQAVFGLLFAGYDLDIALPSLTSLPWLLLIGLAGLLAHTCMTMALALAGPQVVMPIDFLRLPIITVIGAMFYNEGWEWAVLYGAALIFLANWINLRPKPRRAA